jgi:hypothetical protein
LWSNATSRPGWTLSERVRAGLPAALRVKSFGRARLGGSDCGFTPGGPDRGNERAGLADGISDSHPFTKPILLRCCRITPGRGARSDRDEERREPARHDPLAYLALALALLFVAQLSGGSSTSLLLICRAHLKQAIGRKLPGMHFAQGSGRRDIVRRVPRSVVALPSHSKECLARDGPQCSMRHRAKRLNAFAQRRARRKPKSATAAAENFRRPLLTRASTGSWSRRSPAHFCKSAEPIEIQFATISS